MGFAFVASLAVTLGALRAVQPLWAEWVALVLIIVAGIPHGSFDLRVAESSWLPGRSRLMVAALYVAVGAAMSAFCLLWPGVGLGAFLAISALHFSEGEEAGETGAGNSGSGWLPRATAVAFGIGAIIFPIGFHVREAGPYLSFFWGADALASAGPLVLWAALGLFSVSIDLVALDVARGGREQALERMVCLLSWLVLPPLAGFCVWFVGRHSRQHLALCRSVVAKGSGALPADFVVISALAMLLLAPLAARFDLSDITQLFAASIVLIAGLTLPHMIVSHGLGSAPTQQPKREQR